MSRSSRISEILRSAQELAEPIHVHGASVPARALIVARLSAASKSGAILVICANDDTSSSFAADLDSLVSTLGLSDSISTSVFPTWEQSPYSPIAPSIRTRLDRVATLCAVSHPDSKKQIITTSLAALCQASIPKLLFEKHSIRLKKEASIGGREILISNLLAAGYLRVDPVEDPGTFAVRGEIIDIFPPDRDNPVRIELFDDLIERMREFNRETQRAVIPANEDQTNFSLGEVIIPPAREVLINPETLPVLRDRIKARADDVGISRAVRDPILSALNDGIYPDHCDTWAPFAYEKPATLLDYLPPDTVITWNDELSSEQEWDQFRDTQKKLSAEAITSEVIIPAFEDLFRWSKSLEAEARSKSKIYLDQLEMADLTATDTGDGFEPDGAVVETATQDQPVISANHRVFVRANTDLPKVGLASGELDAKFKLWIKQGFKIFCLASTQSQQDRIRFLLNERGIFASEGEDANPNAKVFINVGSLSEGFRWPAEGLVILTESEILGARHVRSARKARKSGQSAAKDWAGLQALSDLGVDDLVVHVDHGIGRYLGLVRLDLSGAPSDFLLLEYANKDKLYLPVYRLNVIQKYAGSGAQVALDRLGTQQFAKTKDKVRDEVKKLAVDLIQLYAERKIRPGLVFSPRDGEFQESGSVESHRRRSSRYVIRSGHGPPRLWRCRIRKNRSRNTRSF
jgi:transcription-repair coupling factor (superfamily II helicase)